MMIKGFKKQAEKFKVSKSEVLTQDEIDALLLSISEDDKPEPDFPFDVSKMRDSTEEEEKILMEFRKKNATIIKIDEPEPSKSLDEVAKKLDNYMCTELHIHVDTLFTIKNILTDWLKSDSKLTCPYCGGEVSEIADKSGFGKCNSTQGFDCGRICIVKKKLYATEEP